MLKNGIPTKMYYIMRKFFSFFSIFSIFSFFLVAGSFNPKGSVEVFVSVENISDSEITWLGAVIEERIEANISKYTNLKLVNNANKKQIFDYQRQSESAAFDDDAVIQAGKFTTAQYGLFATVRKAGSSYTIAIRFTDLTTRENFATVLSNGKKNVEDLYSYNGCAVDEITIELCDRLGISLSPTERHLIMHGDIGLSAEEKNQRYDADVELYSQQIKSLEKEIHTLSISADLDAAFKQKQLEARKALAEEKLKLAKENQRRAAEEVQNFQADVIKDAERTAAQKERINAMSQDLNKKLESVRKTKFEQESVLGQIKVIELKKKALVELQKEIDLEKDRIYDDANKKIAQKKDEIVKRKPRAVETDGRGNLTESARRDRAEEIKSESEKIMKIADSDVKRIKEKIIGKNNNLLKEIYDDYDHLGNKTINTLGNELIVDFGNYDGNDDGWPLFITVKSDDIILFQTTSFLSYEELTGNHPIKSHKDSRFEDFANEVDLYESMFSRGEPILTFELDYSVKPMGLNYPSKYKFIFSALRYYDTRSMSVRGNKLKSSKSGILFLDKTEMPRQMLPAYDISGFDDIGRYDFDYAQDFDEGYSSPDDLPFYDWGSLDDDFDREYDNSERIEIPPAKEVHKKKKATWADGRTLIAMNYGLMGLDMPGSAFQVDISAAMNAFSFLDFTFDVLIPHGSKKTLYKSYNDSAVILGANFKLGGNYRLRLGFFRPNFYGAIGAGIFAFDPDSNSNNNNNVIDWDLNFTTGIDIPMAKDFAITVAYDINYIIGKGMFDRWEFGMAFTVE